MQHRLSALAPALREGLAACATCAHLTRGMLEKSGKNLPRKNLHLQSSNVSGRIKESQAECVDSHTHARIRTRRENATKMWNMPCTPTSPTWTTQKSTRTLTYILQAGWAPPHASRSLLRTGHRHEATSERHLNPIPYPRPLLIHQPVPDLSFKLHL